MKKGWVFLILVGCYLWNGTVYAKDEALHAVFDQENELEGYRQESINTPVKVNTSDSKDQSRDYYMFFGGTRKGDTSQRFLNRESKTNSAVGKDVNKIGILFPSVIGVPKTNIDVIGYSYAYSDGTASQYDGTTGSGFDFAPITDSNGRLANNEMFQTTITSANKSYSSIQELWVNDQTHTIKAYGYATTRGGDKYKVKVTGTSLNSRGRVNFHLEFQNPYSTKRTFASSFGIHMDIYGQHRTSKMYSLGNDRGLYFKHDGSSGAPLIADKTPYFLTFFRGQDSYRTGSYYPVDMFANNNAEAFLRQNFNTTTNVYSKQGISDIAEDGKFSYNSHPGWMFRYPALPVESGEIGAIDLEMAVSAVKTRSVTARYVDEKGNLIHSEVQSVQEYEPYKITYKELPGYRLTKTDGALEGIVEVGSSPTVTFHHTREQFTLKQTVKNESYTSDEDVRNKDQLLLEYQVNSKIDAKYKENLYNDFSIEIPIDKNLTAPTTITTIAGGKTLSNVAVYDQAKGTLTVTIKKAHAIAASEDIKVAFTTTVNATVAKGTKLVFEASAGGSYTQIPVAAVKQATEKVERTVIPRDARLTIQFVDHNGKELTPSLAVDQEIGSTVAVDEMATVQEKIKKLAESGFVVDQTAETNFVMPETAKQVSFRFVKEVRFYLKRTWLGNTNQVIKENQGYLLVKIGNQQNVIRTVTDKLTNLNSQSSYQEVKIRIEKPDTAIRIQPVISGFYQTKGYISGTSLADMKQENQKNGTYSYSYTSTTKDVWLSFLTETKEEKPASFSISQNMHTYRIERK